MYGDVPIDRNVEVRIETRNRSGLYSEGGAGRFVETGEISEMDVTTNMSPSMF